VAPETEKSATTEAGQAELNADVWVRGHLLAKYSSRELRGAEARILERYRDALSGRVLELGCGAGRLSGHLVELAESMQGIDLSPAMVEYCQRTYPAGEFRVGDLRDLSPFGERDFDAVVAPFNVLDVLDDRERREVLAEIRRLLRPGGLFVLSSHNLAYAPSIASPSRIALESPRSFAASVLYWRRRRRNHRELAPFESREGEYAILNDEAHNFSLLHYYIAPDAQVRQLTECGFEFLESIDLDGRTLGPGETAPGCSELHYLARAALPLGVEEQVGASEQRTAGED
jgi:SAM-dependent methyltransferase